MAAGVAGVAGVTAAGVTGVAGVEGAAAEGEVAGVPVHGRKMRRDLGSLREHLQETVTQCS